MGGESLSHEKQKAAMAKEAKKHGDLENTHLINQLLEVEAEAEEKIKRLEKEVLNQYLADREKSKADHAKVEAEYNAKIEMCNKEKEDIRGKVQHVLQSIHNGADNLHWIKKSLENFKHRLDEQNLRSRLLEEKFDKTNELKIGGSTPIKKRREEPSPWTGSQAIHGEFARHANDTLEECKHQNPVKMVVDEYHRSNCSKTLDIHKFY